MKIQKNKSLKNYNTFGVHAVAKEFISISSFEELQKLLILEKDIFLIGGGSNMLFTKNIDTLVVHLNIKGISIDKQAKDVVYVTANAGENWHNFVLWCISKNYGGLENLSLIPGNIGACPIQNIGAYGVEVKDIITKVTTLEIKTRKIVEFSNKKCKFGYRNSIFKQEEKGNYIITSVSFKLTKNKHSLNTSYGAIQRELANKEIKTPTIKNISDAVINIRKTKLPNPKEIGSGGSFFKNPNISKIRFNELQKKHPTIPNYIISETKVKIPAGWLIEQCGFKGKRFGNAGIHTKQALVLVNYANATGKEIYDISKKVQKAVLNKFKINLETEIYIV